MTIISFYPKLKKNTNKNHETRTRNKKKTKKPKQNKQTNLTQNEIFQSP